MHLRKKLSGLFGAVVLSLPGSTFANWTANQQISNSPSSINPTPTTVTLDQNSNAVTGWLQGEVGVDNTIYSASQPAGALTWNDPITIYSGSSPLFVTFPVFYADDLGVVRALWTNFYKDGSVFNEVSLASSSQEALGTDWSDPIISPTMEGFPVNGSGSVDESGNQLGVLALSSDSDTYTPPFSIHLEAMPGDAVAWPAPITLGVDNASTTPAIFASVSQGHGLVGWRLDSPLRFKTSRYEFASDSLDPLSDLILPSGTTNIGFVSGCVAPTGDAIIAFGLQNGEDANYVIYTSSLAAGSSVWTYPQIVSNPSNNTMGNFLSLKTDQEANAVILWGEETPGGVLFIRAGRVPFGGPLTGVLNLTSSSPSESITSDGMSGVNLAVDKFGNAVGVWQFSIDGAPTVQVASRPKGGSWSTPTVFSNTGVFPRVTLNNQGTAQAVWLDSVSHFVYGSRNSQLFSLNPPSDFAGYFSDGPGTDYYLNVHWEPSSAPNVVNYQIFRDGDLIATIGGEGPFTETFLLDCRELDGVYTLVAVGSNGNKSLPVSLTLTN